MEPTPIVEEPNPIIDSGVPGARRRRESGFARGLADGFSEASQAFSKELSDTSTCGELVESVIAGVLRANGRFLDELASTSRRVSSDVRSGPEGMADDYLVRLADLIADRIVAVQPPTPSSTGRPTPDIDYDHLASLVAAHLARKAGPLG